MAGLDINSDIEWKVVSSHSANIASFIHSSVLWKQIMLPRCTTQRLVGVESQEEKSVVSGHGLTIHFDAQLTAE